MDVRWPHGLKLDQDIADLLQGRSIWIDSVGYPCVYLAPRRRIHRLVMNAPDGVDVDHINRNKLDCRRENLRFATRQQNSCNAGLRSHNKSGYRGVYFCRQTGRWRAEIRAKRSSYKLGRFDAPEDAARAYDDAATKWHGEFAVTNRGLGLLP